jgi:predicted RNase H-like HicB family nuclease
MFERDMALATELDIPEKCRTCPVQRDVKEEILSTLTQKFVVSCVAEGLVGEQGRDFDEALEEAREEFGASVEDTEEFSTKYRQFTADSKKGRTYTVGICTSGLFEENSDLILPVIIDCSNSSLLVHIHYRTEAVGNYLMRQVIRLVVVVWVAHSR